MLHIPISRWGEPYKSLEMDEVVHFATGEAVAEVSRANGGSLQRDMRTPRARARCCARFPIQELIEMVEEGRRALREGDAADGRRHADARRVRPRSSPPAPACPSTCARST